MLVKELPLYEDENWECIVDFPNYIITDHGRVFNLKTGRELKPGKNYSSVRKNRTYTTCYVNLCANGKRKKFYVHRLVANAFLDKPDGIDLVVNHKNHNTSDNRVENLEWITKSENSKDVIRPNKYMNKTIEELLELRSKLYYKSKLYNIISSTIYKRRKQLKA